MTKNETRHRLAVEAHVGFFLLSAAKGGGSYYRRNAMAAHQTWARPFPIVFYVMADSPSSRWAFRSCGLRWVYSNRYAARSASSANSTSSSSSPSSSPEDDPFLGRFIAGKCHGEPAVLLVSACDDTYYGAAGPCCKLDAAITFALSKSAEKQWFSGKPLNYFVFMDDDNYIRVDSFLAWLPSLSMANRDRIPQMCKCRGPDLNPAAVAKAAACDKCGGVFGHKDRCKEVAPGIGMAQLTVWNRRALLKVESAAAKGGTRAICMGSRQGGKGFDVTHDVGVGILAWQAMDIRLCSLPGCRSTTKWTDVAGETPRWKPEEIMVVHGAKERGREIGCDLERFGGQMWMEESNFVGGKGRLKSRDPLVGEEHDAAMPDGGEVWPQAAACAGIKHDPNTNKWHSQYDVHDYFANKPGFDLENSYFRQTSHPPPLPPSPSPSVGREEKNGTLAAARLAWEEARAPLLAYIAGYNRTAHWKERVENFSRTSTWEGKGVGPVDEGEVGWVPFGPADCK